MPALSWLFFFFCIISSKGCVSNLNILEEKENRTWKVQHKCVLNSAIWEDQSAKGIREEPMEIREELCIDHVAGRTQSKQNPAVNVQEYLSRGRECATRKTAGKEAER